MPGVQREVLFFSLCILACSYRFGGHVVYIGRVKKERLMMYIGFASVVHILH